MFERFTEWAQQVVVYASDEARLRGQDSIGTEHLLLGLLRIEGGLAAIALASLGVTLTDVRARVGDVVSQELEWASASVPFTPQAKEALNRTIDEAVALGHDYIGTEHVLLGLAHEGAIPAIRILADLGADPGGVRGAVLAVIPSPRGPARAAPPGVGLELRPLGARRRHVCARRGARSRARPSGRRTPAARPSACGRRRCRACPGRLRHHPPGDARPGGKDRHPEG